VLLGLYQFRFKAFVEERLDQPAPWRVVVRSEDMSERLWCHLAIDPKQLELCNELGALLVGDALPVRQEPV
jgi:hypothetical protein